MPNRSRAPRRASVLLAGGAAALLAAVATLAGGCSGEDGGPASELQVDEVEQAASDPPQKFQVFFDIPSELVSAKYSGLVPVTFGVPFAPGVMQPTDKRRMVAGGSQPLEADYAVRQKWPDGSVKWLLVDALAQLSDGKAQETWLEYHPTDVTEVVPAAPLVVTSVPGTSAQVSVGGKTYQFSSASQDVGKFELRLVDGSTSTVFSTAGNQNKVDVEKLGKIRTTVKVSGEYRDSGGKPGGKFITRYRIYAKTPYVRAYHTMVWTESAARKIGSLTFVPKMALGATAGFSAGVDGVQKTGVLDLLQVDDDTVENGASVGVGGHLDGWAGAAWLTNNPPVALSHRLFVGVRWPWQQHPMRVTASGAGGLRVQLIGPRNPMSLAATDVAAPRGAPHFLEAYEDEHVNLVAHPAANDPPITCSNVVCNPGEECVYNSGSGSYQCTAPASPTHSVHTYFGKALSPRGVGKTWELLVRETSQGIASPSPVPEIDNALLQRPVYAYADPAQSTKAGIPSPASTSKNSPFAEIEGAISKVFDWVTQQRAIDGDFGVWNFGDLQYNWVINTSPMPHPTHTWDYRYWMNQGKGWSLTPWLLYLRSGERKYLENAEQHSRHLMDVDTAHVDNTTEYKWRGGSSGYSMLHFGHPSIPMRIESESEYLGLYYHLTGYERAWDIVEERLLALLEPKPGSPGLGYGNAYDWVTAIDQSVPGAPPSNTRFDRDAYLTIGELAILWELTGKEKLLDLAHQLLTRLDASRASNGWVPGIKTGYWFSHSLASAHRILPAPDSEIAYQTLLAYEKHLGNYLMLGTVAPTPLVPGVAAAVPGGQAEGPSSLWTLILIDKVLRDNGAGDPRYLEVAAQTAAAQAASVHVEAPNRQAGHTMLDIQYLGPQIQGWVATMARLSELPAADRPQGYAPVAYFASMLPAKPAAAGGIWTGRNVFYVLEPSDQAFTVDVDFATVNMGVRKQLRFRIHPPNGAPPIELDGYTEVPPFTAASFGCFAALSSPPALEQLSKYRKGTQLRIPADGVAGAYAIEILNRADPPLTGPCANDPNPPAAWARSSTGKLVHYMPDIQARIVSGGPTAAELVAREQWAGMVAAASSGPSHADSGAFWFKPQSGSQPVSAAYANSTDPTTFVPAYYEDWRRVVLIDPDGERAVNAITGTLPTDNPQGSPAKLLNPSAGLVHTAVVTNWHPRQPLATTGMQPWLSHSDAEWFDPSTVPGVKPPASFLVIDQ